MKCELRSNGQIQIELIPEGKIEEAFIEVFAASSLKGMPIKGSISDKSGLVISVEK